MRLRLLLLTLLFLFAYFGDTSSQDWVNQPNYRLNSIFFIDSNYGWAAGAGGVILRTTNGGEAWIKENSGTTEDLDDVYFVSQTTGWICGEKDQIRRSIDGGINWTRVGSVESGYPAHSIHFLDANTGWVAGYHYIKKSTDGGDTWINPDYSTDRKRSIYFTNANYGWVAFENGTIKRTIDGGTTWLDATTNPTTGTYLAIDFTDNSNGWVVGASDCVSKSTDGGITWVSVTTMGFSGNSYSGLKFISSTTGWIVGTNGAILKTTDAGSSWTQQSTNTTDQLRAITIYGSNGWVCGYNGRILKNSATNPLPVELSSFNTSVNNNIVLLMWSTETETNNYGFEIERKTSNDWLKIGFVEGYGNSNSPKSYSFTDENPVGGNIFHYRLKQIDTDGQFKYSDIVEATLVPTEFALYQNYPNPFNPNTTIKYQTPRECSVSIKVYDLLGAEILELLNEKKDPGIYEIEFNAASLPSGVYLYKLTDGHFTDSKKMLLLK